VQTLGSGGSGVVHVGKWQNRLVAVKLFYENSGDNREFRKELGISFFLILLE
jgi:hypothetical protein